MPVSLPVDAHEGAILAAVGTHRVTIIQGETGCGKSSRVPLMLLRDRPRSKMFVAQPRRIAAHALWARLRAEGHADLVGLRMGHGAREETKRTRLWYVTTGYLGQARLVYLRRAPRAYAHLASTPQPPATVVVPTTTAPTDAPGTTEAADAVAGDAAGRRPA